MIFLSIYLHLLNTLSHQSEPHQINEYSSRKYFVNLVYETNFLSNIVYALFVTLSLVSNSLAPGKCGNIVKA